MLSVALLAGACLVAAALYLNRPSSQLAEPEQPAITVDVAKVVLETVSIPVQAQGTVRPLQETILHAEVQGRVVEVSPAFNVGGFVSQGDVLLKIDPRDYQTSLLRARAAVKTAESNMAQEKGRAEVASREWKKLPANAQRSQAARDLYLRKPQLAQAEAQLLAAQADLDTARDNLERSEIKAPYDALIRGKHTELGQFVAPGTAVAEIFSVDYAEVRLPIPQSKLSYLELPGLSGYQGSATIDLYTDVAGTISHWTATLHRTEGVYDERSRVMYAVARIEDPYGLRPPHRSPLRVGTFVNANIDGKPFPELVRLPRYILRAGNYVWVIDDQQRLQNRRVTTLRAGDDEIYVASGLDSGELVSLTALDNSFAGVQVRIVATTPSSALPASGGGAEADESAAHTGQATPDLRVAAEPVPAAPVPTP
jgi:RND family efflux transporter MFP subunit